MAWMYLLVAGACEVGSTTCLKASDGLTRFWWAIGFVLLLTASMGFLTLAARDIPLGTAYAVWTGIGAAGTVVVQIIWFQDPVSAGRLFFLTLLIGSVIGLKLSSPEKPNRVAVSREAEPSAPPGEVRARSAPPRG